MATREPNHLTLSAAGPAPACPTSIVDLALPYLKGLDHERVETVKLSLRRLDLLQQEHAVLMMPELNLGGPSR